MVLLVLGRDWEERLPTALVRPGEKLYGFQLVCCVGKSTENAQSVLAVFWGAQLCE